MATKVCKVVTYREGLPHIKLYKPLNTWSLDKLKPSPLLMPMATKRGGKVTYLEELPFIKLHNRLITWSCEITRQV